MLDTQRTYPWRQHCRRLLLLAILLLTLASHPPSARAQTSQPTTHTVQAGDTLSAIARQYGVTTEALLAANALENADAIIEGQTLRIPVEVDLPPAGPGAHRVLPGETLSQIARQYAVPLTELLALNGIENPDNVFSGQLLRLPTTSAATTPTAPLNTPATTPPAASNATPPTTHTVQPGETLTGIARRYDVTLEALKAANAIGPDDIIVVGQELTLPGTAPAAAATPAPAATPALDGAPASLPPTHAVQTGETLSGIARRYGLAVDALMAANAITDADALFVGQELLLPNAAAPATPLPEETAPAATTPPTPAERPTPTTVTRSGNPIASLNASYSVRSGDTLARIALRLGVDLPALRQLNKLDENSTLVAGQQLLLPATGDQLRPQLPAQAHLVEPGETLSGLAQQYGLTTADLLTANRLADPNAVYVGQQLIIPTRPVAGTQPEPSRQLGPARSGYFYYTVQPGDTLSELARQFNSTMLAIREYNSLPDNETVYAGLEIRIPYGAPPLALRQPPVPLTGSRFVVSLSRQQCWVYQGDKVRHAWNCSTGYGDWKTRPGNYAVQSKIENAKSSAYRLDMPFWLGIYNVGRYENGIHGLPVSWATGKKIWSTLIGEPATFGCAMLDDPEAATLFRLAYLGMPVHIVN